MSKLENYKLKYETLENEKKIWRTKTGQRSYAADKAGQLREVVREMGRSLKSNIIRRITKNNG